MLKLDAWIITGGLNQGVDRLIGEKKLDTPRISGKNPPVVLGICHWGSLEETNNLLTAQVKYMYLILLGWVRRVVGTSGAVT